MTRYRLTEVYEVDADSEDGAWVALGWGVADRVDSECVKLCPRCGDTLDNRDRCNGVDDMMHSGVTRRAQGGGEWP